MKKDQGANQVAGKLVYDGLFLRYNLENNPRNKIIAKRIEHSDLALLPVAGLILIAAIWLIVYGVWNLTNSDKAIQKTSKDLTTVRQVENTPRLEKQR